MTFLPESDRKYLHEKTIEYEEKLDKGNKGIIIFSYPLPEGKYNNCEVDLLIVFPHGYPDIMPDMFYTFPKLFLVPHNQVPKAANVNFDFDNRSWQRWSRHSPANNWRPGIDGLHTYLKKVDRALKVARP